MRATSGPSWGCALSLARWTSPSRRADPGQRPRHLPCGRSSTGSSFFAAMLTASQTLPVTQGWGPPLCRSHSCFWPPLENSGRLHRPRPPPRRSLQRLRRPRTGTPIERAALPLGCPLPTFGCPLSFTQSVVGLISLSLLAAMAHRLDLRHPRCSPSDVSPCLRPSSRPLTTLFFITLSLAPAKAAPRTSPYW